MHHYTILSAATDQTIYLFVPDASSSVGAGLTGLAYNTSSLTCYYARTRGSATSVTLATQTVTGAHSDGGFVEVDATNAPGWYRLDLPDAVCAAGAADAFVHLKGATNMVPVSAHVELSVAGVILGSVVEGSLTIQNVLRIMLAALTGKAAGGGTTSITYRDLADTKARVTLTVATDTGNRTASTVDGS